MFKWRKMGKLFDPREHGGSGWMREFAQSASALIYDTHVRVFFCSRPAPQNGQYVSLLAYIDLDRNDLRKILGMSREPILQLGGYGTFDEFGTNPISVIREGDEIRVYYAGWTRCESVPFNAAIGVAISRDNGNSFERLGEGPVLSYAPDEPFLLGSPRVRKYGAQWHLWYVSGRSWIRIDDKPEPVYKIRMASSNDGINWTRLGKDLIENKLGEQECQACPDVTLHGGRYHMFFSYRQSHNYKGKEGGYRIGYACSADMLNWTRRDELAGMRVSRTGWDSEMVCYPHIFALDDEFYMLYQGNEIGRSGIGLAKLEDPRDWSVG